MKKYLIIIIITLLFSPLSYAAQPSFTKAKKQLRKLVVTYHPKTFYCGCKINKHYRPILKSCGYMSRKNLRRASRIEAEHIVPAWAFGHLLRCWREKICSKRNGKKYKGRKCCEKIDPRFREMESDLHNLVPAIGEVNGDRNNFRYSLLNKQPYQYGRCDFIVDFSARKVQPAPNTRGFIARTYFYMKKMYGLRISKSQMKLFALWNRQYPPTQWELKRDQLISKDRNS